MIKKINLIQKTLNSILKHKYSNEYIYGLPIFYIQKGHTEYLKPFLDYLSIKNNLKNYENLFFKIIKHIYLLFFSNKEFFSKNVKQKKYDIFLISNIISKNQLKVDYIYGNLSKELNSNKINTLTIYKNFTDKRFDNKSLKSKDPIVILSKTSSLIKEISFLFGLLYSYRSIQLLKKKVKNKQHTYFLKYISKIKYLIPIVSNLRLSYQIITLVSIYNPKIIILPFENHAWERFLIYKLKKCNTKVITAGYQFSTFSQNQFSKYSVLKKNFNPDLMLSSGLSTYKYLNKIYKKKIKVFNFGSYRNLQKKIYKKNFNNFNFLMVPEAPLSEVNTFLRDGIDLAKMYPKYNFILRLHPMSKSKKLISDINYKMKNYKNIKLSKQSVEDDFSRCSYILYRSSSLAVAASAKGLFPIYIDNNSLNIDPFFEINKKLSIKSPKQLKSVLKIKNLEKKKLLKKFMSYSQNYFEQKKINNFLNLFY